MPKRIICPKCEYIGVAALKKRGSTKMELIGWLVLFPLGIPYSIWRMFGKIPVCKNCSHDLLVDEDSIVGQKMMEKIYGLPPLTADLLKPMSKLAENPAPKPTMEPREPKDWQLDKEQF